MRPREPGRGCAAPCAPAVGPPAVFRATELCDAPRRSYISRSGVRRSHSTPHGDMDELHHECGVAALYCLKGRAEKSGVWTGDADQISRLMPRMLLDLQNRGQLAAGMTTFNPARDRLCSTPGRRSAPSSRRSASTTPDKFASIMEDYAGRAAIGHTRYATCGAPTRSYAQPFEPTRVQVEVVRVRVQRPAHQLPRPPPATPEQPRLPPHPGQRHRSHHALHRPRDVRGDDAARPGGRCSAASAASSTGRTTSCS